jgi:hypothetical protein
MKVPSANYFLDSIRHLRNHEEMIIYDRFNPQGLAGEDAVRQFLQEEYEHERVEYPGTCPEFEPDAALWAARTVYIASQFLLYRDKGLPATREYLLPYPAGRTPGAILSADLCLRFLPSIMEKAKELNSEDWLVTILEEHLRTWHFSGVGYPLTIEGLDWDRILANDCVKQLYVDRVISRKAKALAEVPALRREIMAALGAWSNHIWKELLSTI